LQDVFDALPSGACAERLALVGRLALGAAAVVFRLHFAPQVLNASRMQTRTKTESKVSFHCRLAIAVLGLAAALSATAHAAPDSHDPLQDIADPVLQFVQTLDSYVPGDEVAGTLRLWGHGSHKRNFMGKLVTRWVEEFSRFHPHVLFENRMYGTASAVGALYTGAGDIALLGEEISPAAAAAFRRARGYAPTLVLVATGSLDVNYFDYAHMIFVHESNPLAGLSLSQLDAIFGAEHRRSPGNIRRWGQLGLTGKWSRLPIQPYGWQVDVDFALFFRDRVLGGSHRWNPAIREYVHQRRPDGTQYDHGQQILDALAKDPAGIALSNSRYLVPGVKALPLSWRNDGDFVAATRASLINQAYPLVRLIPAVIDRAPGKSVAPAVREFLRYVLSREGQIALVEESGYLPLSKKAIARQLDVLR